MAYKFLVTIEGTRQGKIKGQPTQKGKLDYNDGIEIHGFSFGATTPTDPSTGAGGPRRFSAITVSRDTDYSSPLLMSTIISSALLNSVGLHPAGPGGPGGGGSGSGSSSGDCKNSNPPIIITKLTDTSSANLFRACYTNELLKTVKISFTPTGRGKQEQWQTITLTNASIVNIRRTSTSGTGQPSEEIQLNYEHLGISYLPPK